MSSLIETNISIDILNQFEISQIATDLSVQHLDRRAFLKKMVVSGLALLPATTLSAENVNLDTSFWQRPKELYLYRRDTKEYARFIYFQNGQWDVQGLRTACYLLRDIHQNKSVYMDGRLLDLLRAVYGYFQINNHITPLVITSGYRTVTTNSKLSKEGAAKNSMHLYGKAVDFYVPNIPLKTLEALGKYYQQGGVGFYPNRQFLHLDTGNVRYWQGK